jgi:hypothetical protein
VFNFFRSAFEIKVADQLGFRSRGIPAPYGWKWFTALTPEHLFVISEHVCGLLIKEGNLEIHINFAAILVCGVFFMVLGAFWYSPLLFGRIWRRSMGKTEAEPARLFQ